MSCVNTFYGVGQIVQFSPYKPGHSRRVKQIKKISCTWSRIKRKRKRY